MQKFFIAGSISPNILNNASEYGITLKKCDILEIRYDLFKNAAEWNYLAQKVYELNPKAIRLGTIRLERDGGEFKNEKAALRSELFAGKALNWVDIERGENLDWVKNTKFKVLYSWHLFDRIPSEQELCDFAEESLRLGVHGCKVAAMANSDSKMEVLYNFAKKYGSKFNLFSAFAMGNFGTESRTQSLKEGANLTFAYIDRALAPGQIGVEEISSYLQ